MGYRVNSARPRSSASGRRRPYREFVIKGFVLDDRAAELNKRFGKDTSMSSERIRKIRASERRFYLKITDIYEQCSIDYTRIAPAHRDLLQDRAEQAPLGRHRQDGGGDHRQPRDAPNLRWA